MVCLWRTCREKDPITHTSPSALKTVQQTCSRRCGNSSPQYPVAPPVTSLTGTHSALHLALQTKRWQGGELHSGGHKAAWAVPHVFFGDRSTELSKLAFLSARPPKLPSFYGWASPCFLWSYRFLFTSFSRNKGFWHHRVLLILTLHSHPHILPVLPLCPKPGLILSRSYPTVAAVRFYLVAHPSHREPSAKIIPSTSFGYSVHSLQFLTTPQARNRPWLYLYFSGNAAVCIFQSGCCCHSSQSGHCQKLQATDSPEKSEEAEQQFFRLSDPI